MNSIDNKLNKCNGKQNKARAVVVQEYDFSKLESDLAQIKSQNNCLAQALGSMVQLLSDNNKLLEHMTEQQSLANALERKAQNKIAASARNSDGYKAILEALDCKRFMTTSDVIELCEVSKPTATKLMRIVSKDHEDIQFVEHHSTTPARIFRNKRMR